MKTVCVYSSYLICVMYNKVSRIKISYNNTTAMKVFGQGADIVGKFDPIFNAYSFNKHTFECFAALYSIH